MNKQVNRLVSCGIPDAEALRIVKDFLKDFSADDLEIYITSLEKECFHATTIF